MAELTIESLKVTTGLTDVELDKAFQEDHLAWLAPHFGSPLIYIEANGFDLMEARKEDVRKSDYIHGAETGMLTALRFWFMESPFATTRMLLETMLRVGEKRINLFSNLCKVIKGLKVECNNVAHHCHWTGILGELETHLQSCGYVLKSCPNGCTSPGGQETKVLAKDLENHKTNKCPKRNYMCEFCHEDGSYDFMKSDHLETCPAMLIACPNEPCTSKILRCGIEAHCSTCPYEPVPCKYSKVGCRKRPLRKDLKEHEEDAQLHLRITAEKVLDLTEKLAKLQQKQTDDRAKLSELIKEQQQKQTNLTKLLNNMQQTITDNQTNLCKTQEEERQKQIVLSEKLDNMQRKTTDDQTSLGKKVDKLTEHYSPPSAFRCNFGPNEFYSPPFYTSLNGYKMCVRVDAHGSGTGEGTHVSVYTYLMKGDNDDSLTWPFTRTVTFELLNQLEDKNHHKKSATFPDDAYSQRVVTGERAGGGYGHQQFIPLADLEHQPEKNCQYLKDNVLVFRVFTKAPWLECTI